MCVCTYNIAKYGNPFLKKALGQFHYLLASSIVSLNTKRSFVNYNYIVDSNLRKIKIAATSSQSKSLPLQSPSLPLISQIAKFSSNNAPLQTTGCNHTRNPSSKLHPLISSTSKMCYFLNHLSQIRSQHWLDEVLPPWLKHALRLVRIHVQRGLPGPVQHRLVHVAVLHAQGRSQTRVREAPRVR